jgi:phosphomannomutase/phosphoglucomutase
MTASAVISADIFRAYDIRGIVGHGLDAASVQLIGQAIGSEALDVGQDTLITGADARLSSPSLAEALRAGILASGCNVIDLGIVPTPLVYFATHTLGSASGAMLTGSHNPREYNGIKIVLNRHALADNQITRLRERIVTGELRHGAGACTSHDIMAAYVARITGSIRLRRQFKVVIDCGNGVVGLFAPRLFEALGCEVITLYCDADGNFPNHHPDPTCAENLHDLLAVVEREQADLGIAFDGDGDRVGLVTADGEIIDADHLLLAFVMDILPDNPGASVVFDVKSSHHLARVITAGRGHAVMCKSGHSFVKKMLHETEALVGGEYSAHIFFKHRWYGFDDGMYTAARFLELMDKYDATALQLLEKMPQSCSTPELFITVPEADKFALMERLCKELRFTGAGINLLDGLRADFTNGWGLIRASNTTPRLVLRFEADSPDALRTIQERFRKELLRLAPELQLPF